VMDDITLTFNMEDSMKNLFVGLLIFIFVMCFFFIPHAGASQAPKAEFSIMGICQDDSRLRIGIEQSIMPMAQTPLNKIYYKNNLFCERYVSTRPITKRAINVPALALKITVYKAMSPRSFHAGK